MDIIKSEIFIGKMTPNLLLFKVCDIKHCLNMWFVVREQCCNEFLTGDCLGTLLQIACMQAKQHFLNKRCKQVNIWELLVKINKAYKKYLNANSRHI